MFRFGHMFLSCRVMSSSVYLAACVGAIFCTRCAAQASGQPACALRGKVGDSSGAALPGALVQLQSSQPLALPVILHLTATGDFRACTVAAGDYQLSISAPGFESISQPVHIGETPGEPLTIVLVVAHNEITSTVTAESEDRIEVDPATVGTGTTLSAAQAASVPLNGRSFTDLLLITPGVVPVSSAQPNAVVMSGVASTPPSGDLDIGALSVSGQRETSNAFRVNGANVQEDVNMGVAIIPTLDSIAELSVLTSPMDAKYGNQSGGQIFVTTRSGADRIHASLYEYFRNTALDARNFFAPTRAPFNQNQFGGTIGGYLNPFKTHIFIDYQGTRTTEGFDSGQVDVPTLAERSGNFTAPTILSQLTGAVSTNFTAQRLSTQLNRNVSVGEKYSQVLATPITPGQFAAPAQTLLEYIPKPNVTSGIFEASSDAERVRDDKGALRLDRSFYVGEFSGYYFADNYTVLNPYPTAQGGATVPGFNARNRGLAQLVDGSLNSPIGAGTVNTVNVSYMRNAALVGTPVGGLGPSLASQGFVTGENSLGIVPQQPNSQGVENVIFNDFTMGLPVTNLFQAENLFQVADDLTRMLGRHTLTFGTGFHTDQINTHPNVYDNGSFNITGAETGLDFADFVLGIDSTYTQGHGQYFYNRNHYLGLYAQDRFNVRHDITVTYGLRWDVLPPWSEKHNQLLSLDPNEQSVVFPTAPKGILFPGDPGIPSTIAPTKYTNLAPRLAAAWTPLIHASEPLSHILGKDGQTVVRGGYGVFYTAIEGLSAAIMSGNPPYGVTLTTSQPTLLAEPFAAAETGQPVSHSVGQPFPLVPTAFGASKIHPNSDVDWAQFEPLVGIPAFDYQNVTPYAENYNLTVERSIGTHISLSASFVGTQSHHLLVIQEVNPGNPQLCLSLSQPSEVAPGSATCGPFSESGTFTSASGQVYQGTRSTFSGAFGSVNLQRTIANAHDNAFELSVRHASRTFFLQAGYTWSKSIDQSSSLAEAVYPANVHGGAGADRALSAFDLRQNFVASYKYLLPIDQFVYRHQRLAEGWQVSGLTRFSTGLPITLINNNDTSLLGTAPNGINNNGIDEPYYSGGPLHLLHHPVFNADGTQKPAFDTNQLTLPALGTLGNARRRFFYGPGSDNTDFSISKSTPLGEGSLEIRLEAFNLFNHSQFFGPAAISGNISSQSFGEFQSAAPPRLLQLSTRFSF